MRLFTLRGPVLRVPWPLVLLGWAARGMWTAGRWLAVHTAVAAALALAVLAWWAVDRDWWPWLLLATGMICVGMGAAMELQPAWWRKVSARWASHRRLRWYRRDWERVMFGCGLSRGDDSPRLIAHRFGGILGERDLDVLAVAPVPGQVIEDWRHVQHRLAAAWGRTRVRVRVIDARRGWPDPLMLELLCSSRPLPTRTAVAGATLPPSTPVDEPVDDTPRGAFPRSPRP